MIYFTSIVEASFIQPADIRWHNLLRSKRLSWLSSRFIWSLVGGSDNVLWKNGVYLEELILQEVVKMAAHSFLEKIGANFPKRVAFTTADNSSVEDGGCKFPWNHTWESAIAWSGNVECVQIDQFFDRRYASCLTLPRNLRDPTAFLSWKGCAFNTTFLVFETSIPIWIAAFSIMEVWQFS